MRKLMMLSASLATAFSLAACGGGGSSGNDSAKTSDNATDTPSSTFKLADPTNDHAIAKKATADTLFAARDIYQLYASTLHGVLNGSSNANTGTLVQSCTGGGSATITFTDADNSHSITQGDSESVSFSGCKLLMSTLDGPTVETLDGGMTLSMNSVDGTIGSSSDYGFTADASASNLTVSTDTTTSTINGTMTFVEKHSPANGTASTIATAQSITVGRVVGGTQTTLTLANWAETDNYTSQTNIDTIAVNGKLGINSADINGTLAVSTPVAAKPTDVTAYATGNIKLATTTDSVVATMSGTSTVTLAIDAGNTGKAQSNVSTSLDELTSLIAS